MYVIEVEYVLTWKSKKLVWSVNYLYIIHVNRISRPGKILQEKGSVDIKGCYSRNLSVKIINFQN